MSRECLNVIYNQQDQVHKNRPCLPLVSVRNLGGLLYIAARLLLLPAALRRGGDEGGLAADEAR